MSVPIKITNKYTVVDKIAVKLLKVTVKESVSLNFGDTIVLNPRTPTVLEIQKAQIAVAL